MNVIFRDLRFVVMLTVNLYAAENLRLLTKVDVPNALDCLVALQTLTRERDSLGAYRGLYL